MSADDQRDSTDGTDETENVEPADLRAELDRQRNRDTRPGTNGGGIVDLLSAAFDTDTRTRVYVALRREPNSTAEDLAEITGLYPAAVERVLSDLHDEDVVERHEAATPEYTAAAPMEAVDAILGRVQGAIDERFSLGRSRSREPTSGDRSTEPVTIPVEKSEDTDSSDEPDE